MTRTRTSRSSEGLAHLRPVGGRRDHRLRLAVAESKGEGVGAEEGGQRQHHGSHAPDGGVGHRRLERGRVDDAHHVTDADAKLPERVGEPVGVVLDLAEGMGRVRLVLGHHGEGGRGGILVVDTGDAEVERFGDREVAEVHLGPQLVVARGPTQERFSHGRSPQWPGRALAARSQASHAVWASHRASRARRRCRITHARSTTVGATSLSVTGRTQAAARADESLPGPTSRSART